MHGTLVLRQRIITALVLAPLVLAGVFLLSDIYFALFIGFVLVIAGWEWAALAGLAGTQRYVYSGIIAAALVLVWFLPAWPILLVGSCWWIVAVILVINYPASAVTFKTAPVRYLIGLLILVPAWVSLNHLKADPAGNYLLLTLFLLIWSADIGAYFFGRAFGRTKLAPAVSPGKSWQGVYGGVVAAILILVTLEIVAQELVYDSPAWWLYLAGCVVVVMISVAGDLTESMFKRRSGVKDSSNLLPGHGGVLDRIDALVAAGPVFALLLTILGRL